MAYFLDLFTPETWEAFRVHGAAVSGFREKQRKTAERLRPGDIFVCYVVRLSRWCGILEVKSSLFVDSTPIFSDPDPFIVRFRVDAQVVLELEHSIPILDEAVWSRLSLTKDIERGAPSWAQIANLRASLRPIGDADGRFLRDLLLQQKKDQKAYLFSTQDKQRMGIKASIRTVDRAVLVEVPAASADESEVDEKQSSETLRASHRIQATIARIGAEMGFRIWVPKADKQKVLGEIAEGLQAAFLDVLPSTTTTQPCERSSRST